VSRSIVLWTITLHNRQSVRQLRLIGLYSGPVCSVTSAVGLFLLKFIHKFVVHTTLSLVCGLSPCFGVHFFHFSSSWFQNWTVYTLRPSKMCLDYFVCVRLFPCIISARMLYYCNTVRWAWLVWGLSGWLTTLLQCFDTVGWVIRPVKPSAV